MRKYETRKRRSISSRTFIMLLAVTLLIGCAIGGTVAWLTAKTDPVVNTFTYGDINIELNETKPANQQAKIIPGVNIEKDPKVTVKANSEACWLFVKIKEENWPTLTETDRTIKKVSYDIATDWKPLEGQAGVYYREVDATTANAGVSYYILKGDTAYPNGVVTVSENLTKNEVNSITTQPKLTFTAYAVQKDGISTAADAWAKVSTSTTTTP